MDLQSVEDLEFFGAYPVALPMYRYTLDVDVLIDRKLRHVETTLLRLVEAGVGEPDQISALMGLTDSRITVRAIVGLLEKNLLTHEQGLKLTAYGRHILQGEVFREPKRLSGVRVLYDPFADEFVYSSGESEYRLRQARQAELHLLPVPVEPNATEIRARYHNIQKIMSRSKPDIERALKLSLGSTIDVLDVHPSEPQLVYIPAEICVYTHSQKPSPIWFLRRGGVRDLKTTDVLRRMEREGHQVLPLEDAPKRSGFSERIERIRVADGLTLAEAREGKTLEFIGTAEHRKILQEAIHKAEHMLIIVAPWLTRDAVDEDFVRGLHQALEQRPFLHTYIIFGIERYEEMSKERKKQETAKILQRLLKLEKRFSPRLEVWEHGNTHEKILVCDERFCVVTSFNFLSFNPNSSRLYRGEGLRSERGVVIRRRESIKELKEICLSEMRQGRRASEIPL